MSLTLRQLAEAHKAGEAKKKAEARQKRVHDFAKKLYSQYKASGGRTGAFGLNFLQFSGTLLQQSNFSSGIQFSSGWIVRGA
eukprot:1160819-Pelagomonas_calceolata.AAC.4